MSKVGTGTFNGKPLDQLNGKEQSQWAATMQVSRKAISDVAKALKEATKPSDESKRA